MSIRRTPELSVEGTLEILHELEHGPVDTPQRRATLEGAEAMRPHLERMLRNTRKER